MLSIDPAPPRSPKSDTSDRDGSDQLISIVVPCFEEEAVLPELLVRLRKMADDLEAEAWCRCELVLVDDGSRDRTWPLIVAAHAADARLRGVRLSRNFGQQAALTCGYAVARGDAVVCLDADLQDPPEAIAEMVQRWREGSDVVYGIRDARDGETWFKLLTAKCFCGASQLVSIGLLGEYLGRTFSQVQQRPLFIVQEATDATSEIDEHQEPALSRYEDCCARS